MTPPAASIRVVAAVIARDGAYLITQRRASAVLPLLWEFPGGRVEDGETDVQALRREIAHRLGVEVSVGQLIGFVSHPYPGYTLELALYECLVVDGELAARAVEAVRWVTSDQFEQIAFTPADAKSMATLLGLPD